MKLSMLLFLLTLSATITNGIAAHATTATTAPTKLWADDLPSFLNQNSRGRWIVGTSQQPALSAEEAETFALRDAAESLAPVIQIRLTRRMNDSALRQQIQSSLRQSGWIKDRSVTQTQRPYATIWSEKVLVDASEPKLQALTSQLDQSIRRERGRRNLGVVSGTLLFVIVALGYASMNWFTRGYFRGRLVMLSALALAAGLMTITHLL
jgi:hypothetical protein